MLNYLLLLLSGAIMLGLGFMDFMERKPTRVYATTLSIGIVLIVSALIVYAQPFK